MCSPFSQSQIHYARSGADFTRQTSLPFSERTRVAGESPPETIGHRWSAPERAGQRFGFTPELEERLRHEAERNGVPEAECIVRILDAHLPSASRRAQAVALLQSWIDGKDADDQREIGDYLVRVLHEDRLSNRKLFPPELKGQTW